MFRKSIAFILLACVLLGVIPIHAQPPAAPNSLAHKTEMVFWSNVVPVEKEGKSWLTFTHGSLYMETQADKTKCNISPLYVYYQGELKADLRCGKFVWKRGGAWIPLIRQLYQDLP